MGRPLEGDQPLTGAERSRRYREQLAKRHDVTKNQMSRDETKPMEYQPPPQMVASGLLGTAGSAYCRELARCLLLAAIWHDAGRPDQWADGPSVHRMVSVWCQVRTPDEEMER